MTAFPPVDDAVLQNNPDFSNLYNKLTNVILNPDGSTKEDPAAKERAIVREVGIRYILQCMTDSDLGFRNWIVDV